jgi:lon-related putative ATP-dependent protease
MTIQALSTNQLYNHCDEAELGFQSTEDIAAIDAALGQQRAVDAIRFAMDMPHEGYNLYVAGSTGVGKHQLVNQILSGHKQEHGEVFDWCYINNFSQPHKPSLLKLPRGSGTSLKSDMEKLIERLLMALPNTFQSDEYRQRIAAIQEEFQEREEKLFKDLEQQARELELAIMRTPNGFTIGPVKDGKLLGSAKFHELPDADQTRIKANIDAINEKLKSSLQTINSWQEEGMERVKELNRGFVRQAIDPAMSQLKAKYEQLPAVMAYLDVVHVDITNSAGDFMGEDGNKLGDPPKLSHISRFQRYQINLLVDNSGAESPPIVYEDNPTYQNLIGHIENYAEYGALTTNFTLIKAGALHRANGGYLILDAHSLLLNSFSWQALKRVIRSREIRIESVERILSLATTVTLEPEPLPSDVKIILCGDRMLYYLLKYHDPDFDMLFKVQADFSETIERSADVTRLYAGIIGSIARREKLRPLAASGVARIIEQCSRNADDSGKLSLHMQQLGDLIREADYHARQEQSLQVERRHVQAAVDQRIWRSSRYRELLQEQIEQGTLLLATSGDDVAQVNGLSVFQLGDFSFGRPARITATARPGSGKLIDIERETDLGGSIHSKGVMILGALLASCYARNLPLALSATLVFEQSYGPIDGDSASAAELLCLLSAISQKPLRQSLAITGSINQLGQVQAIGGVNEKIEGYFDICVARGLTGDQGVAIPASNVRHLMLREDVVVACAEKRFAIYPLSTLDEAIELFSGMPAGIADAQGHFAKDSFNRAVEDRLEQFRLTMAQQRNPAGKKNQDPANG